VTWRASTLKQSSRFIMALGVPNKESQVVVVSL
jgi:hypothetical protein